MLVDLITFRDNFVDAVLHFSTSLAALHTALWLDVLCPSRRASKYLPREGSFPGSNKRSASLIEWSSSARDAARVSRSAAEYAHRLPTLKRNYKSATIRIYSTSTQPLWVKSGGLRSFYTRSKQTLRVERLDYLFRVLQAVAVQRRAQYARRALYCNRRGSSRQTGGDFKGIGRVSGDGPSQTGRSSAPQAFAGVVHRTGVAP